MEKMKEAIANWLYRIEKDETIPCEITAFNFGLFEQERGYCVYLTGSIQYDEADDDWACNVDFEPKEKYIELTTEQCMEMSWEEFQATVREIISDYIGKASVKSMFRSRERIVTIGFDDGELEKIEWQQEMASDAQLHTSDNLKQQKSSVWDKGMAWLKIKCKKGWKQ